MISTPYQPDQPPDPTRLLVAGADRPTAELDAAPGEFLRRMFHTLSGAVSPARPDAVPTLPWSWLSADEFAVFENTFAATGFTGTVDWRRAAHLDRDESVGTGGVLDVPAYFLDGGRDPLLARAGRDAIGRMRETMPRLRAVHTYDDAGHFVMAEAARDCGAAIVGFARGVC